MCERCQGTINHERREPTRTLESNHIEGLVACDLDRVVRDPRDLMGPHRGGKGTRHPLRTVKGSLQLDNDADLANTQVPVAMATSGPVPPLTMTLRTSNGLRPVRAFRGGLIGSSTNQILPDQKALLHSRPADQAAPNEGPRLVRQPGFVM